MTFTCKTVRSNSRCPEHIYIDTLAACHISGCVVDAVGHIPSTYLRTAAHSFLICLQHSVFLCPRIFSGWRSTAAKTRSAGDLMFLILIQSMILVLSMRDRNLSMHSTKISEDPCIQLSTAVICLFMGPGELFLPLLSHFPSQCFLGSPPK